MSHIPEGFHAVTLYLHVPDGAAYLDFVQRAFGAEVRHITREGDRIRHAEIVLEGSIIEFGESPDLTHVALHVFVPDPDAAHARALAAGATLLYEVTDHPYGERSGGVRDAWGNSYYLAAVTDPVARRGE